MWRGKAVRGTRISAGSCRTRSWPAVRIARWEGFRGGEGTTAGTYQLQPKVLWGELHRAHGALGVDEHGALDPSCGTRATGTCAVELATVDVRCGYLLPDLDGTVEGRCGEDGAEFGVRPAEF